MKDSQRYKKQIHILVGLGIILISILLINFLNVGKINCIINSTLETKVCDNFDSLLDKSILFYDFDADPIFDSSIENSEKSYTYYLEKIEKRLPNQLIIYLTAKPPLYRFHVKSSSFLISESGLVKNDINDLSITSVHFLNESDELLNDVQTGEKINADIHSFIKQIIITSQEKNLNLNQIKLIDKSLVELYFSKPDLKYIVELDANILNNIERIEIIEKNLDVEEIIDGSKEIDMRFNYPVLR